MPVYSGTQPSRENTAQYTYTFSGWSPEVSEVTGNASYTAVYSTTVNKYTVTFYDEDCETILQSSDFEYGQMPVFSGEIPVKPATAQYTYTFDGWTPKIVAVTGPAQYIIVYKATLNSYTVTFYDEDGTSVLESKSVEYGTVPESTGDTPVKQGDAQYSYTFKGWDPEITAVTGNASYTAVYDRTVNTYTVTWKDDAGNVIGTETYEYGQTPAHDAPVKENTAQYTYTFAGWSPKIEAVKEDAVYTAVFNATVNTYTVTFRDDSGNALFSKVYSYGEVPAYEGDEVKKEPTAQYTFVFAGWSDGETTYTRTLPAVTGAAVYTAVFDSTVNSYTISFINWNDEVLETDTYQYGVTPAYSGDTPVKEGDAQYSYTFDGWDSEIAEVTGDKTYKAVYTQTVNEYTVTFKAENGTVLAEEKYKYGTVPAYTGTIPVKEGTEEHIYSFAGFSDGENIYDGALPDVKADVTYTCAYDTWDMPVWTWNSETSCSVSFASESGHDPFTPEVSAQSTEGTGADYGMTVTTASAIGPDGKTYTSVNKAENTITVTLQTPQNQPVLVRISRNGTPAMSVIIPRGSTSVTIYRVPFGSYTVSEGSENWRLTDSSETAVVSAEQRHPEFILVPVAKEGLTNLWRVTLNVFELG